MKTNLRIASIDMVRGVVMIIMAIDHTREFFGAHPFRPEDLSQASATLFLTRFITHLCAPAFIFLSGISICLRQQNSEASTRAFVLKRGLWLIAVELLIMGPIVTHGYNVVILGIFWVIGASMMMTSLLMRLPRRILLVLSLLIIAGQHLLPIIDTGDVTGSLLGLFYHTPFVVPLKPVVVVAYTILPWLGIMLLGYCVGPWFQLDAQKRKSYLLSSALLLVVIFIALRLMNVYGDLQPWSVQDRGMEWTILSFFNVTKYPASMLFICLMLAVTAFLLAALENRRGWWSGILLTFGQVPFFFFILHFFLLSITSALWASAFLGRYVNFAIASPAEWPDTYEPSLLRVYVIWILLIVVCYFPVRWFGEYRRKSQKRWLSYL